ncbi:MAG: ribosomal protein S18-alanine N-acetyltransferase [Lachnospiraceae bacterium]|nr:ribosomal protein S18-alanine N-acetyltransferase [Lachnospiraceae bacterium]MCR4697424.1 ribosomal protein S18-alanine N-acetyltransferase [Lachnospiraceae bacterium]
MDSDNVSGVAELEKQNFSDGWSEASLREELDNPYALYLVALDDSDVVIGAAGLIQSMDEADIMNVSVAKDARRQGIASKLLTALLDEGKKRGINAFTLEVRETNTSARALYEKFGFENAGTRKDFYTNPADNAVIYWLR